MNVPTVSLRIGWLAAGICCIAAPASAQRLSGEETIDALTDGGYVLVMRQAAASLDAARQNRGGGFGFGGGGGGGRGGAQAPEPTEEALEQESTELLTGMRHAIWHFAIPIGAIHTSPTAAARQQADEVPFAEITVNDALGVDSATTGGLRDALTAAPADGTNTILITHGPNIENDLGLSVAEGETLVVRPGDEPEVVGRLGLREWSVLAIELGS